MTLGEYRVGISFIPSPNPLVDEIKKRAAELIDLCATIPGGDEVRRLVALAQTHIEDAAMWGVQAATKGPMS
jgi:hypothetical protein